MPSEGLGVAAILGEDIRGHGKKKKARSCIVKPQEERRGLNKREGENWQRKSLTMSPSGIKLLRNLFIYNLVNLAAPLLQG